MDKFSFDDDIDDNDKRKIRITLEELLELLIKGQIDGKTIQNISPNPYDAFEAKVVNLVFEHFHHGFQMDYMLLFYKVINAILAVLNSQIGRDPSFDDCQRLTEIERRKIANNVQNYIGHLLALKKIAKVRTEDDFGGSN